mgnify:FL=1
MLFRSRYAKAIGAGKVNDALATRSAAARKRIQAALKDRKQRQSFLDFAKFLTFDSIDVQHATLAKDGASATLITIATKKIPADAKLPPGGPAPGSIARIELTLDFVREARVWKFDEQTLGGDPDKIVACKDASFEPREAYALEKNIELGGPVRRVEFKPDYTLVVVRVLDEENCVFLPDRAKLAGAGVKPDGLVPYAIVRVAGAPHKTDKQKVLAADISVYEDD